MLLGEKIIPGTIRPKCFLLFRCDVCGNEFERRKGSGVERASRHYCNKNCGYSAMRSGGLADSSRKASMFEKYGVRSNFALPSVIKVVVAKAHTPEANAKRRESLIKKRFDDAWVLSRGLRLARSRGEIAFVEKLQTMFEVVPQKYINGWYIDVYIRDIDIYVQFDGVFWHGLDRPIEIIRQSVKTCDQQIARKWDTDRSQDEWFSVNNLTLVRVTDKEWIKSEEACLKRLIEFERKEISERRNEDVHLPSDV